MGYGGQPPLILPPSLYRNLPKPRKAGKLEQGGDSHARSGQSYGAASHQRRIIPSGNSLGMHQIRSRLADVVRSGGPLRAATSKPGCSRARPARSPNQSDRPCGGTVTEALCASSGDRRETPNACRWGKTPARILEVTCITATAARPRTATR